MNETRWDERGLQHVLDFLDALGDANVHYQVRPDSILVFLTLVGTRVEVDVFVDP